MIRRLLNLLSVMSALLCVVVVTTWLLSYTWRYQRAVEYRSARGNEWRFVSHRGRCWLENRRRPDAVVVQNLSHRKDQVLAELNPLRQRRVHDEKFRLAYFDGHGDEETRNAVQRYRRLLREYEELETKFGALEREARSRHLQTRRVSYAVLAPPLFAVGLLGPVARAFGRLHRTRRMQKGRCPSCRYDMRMTPDRCPECGFEPSRSLR